MSRVRSATRFDVIPRRDDEHQICFPEERSGFACDEDRRGIDDDLRCLGRLSQERRDGRGGEDLSGAIDVSTARHEVDAIEARPLPVFPKRG